LAGNSQYGSIGKSTPSQNRRLDTLICNSKQYVDDFAGGGDFLILINKYIMCDEFALAGGATTRRDVCATWNHITAAFARGASRAWRGGSFGGLDRGVVFVAGWEVSFCVCLRGGGVQGYLAHDNKPIPLGPPEDPS